jgi:hypothetical protein
MVFLACESACGFVKISPLPVCQNQKLTK